MIITLLYRDAKLQLNVNVDKKMHTFIHICAKLSAEVCQNVPKMGLARLLKV